MKKLVKESIDAPRRKAKDIIYKLLKTDAPITDISCASYDIANYALHKFTKDNDMRKFRMYIEGKIEQYIMAIDR